MEHLGKEQREFITTEPGSGVGPAEALVEAMRHLDEHRVSGGMSALGIDPPEVLEVDGDDAHDMTLGVALEQRPLNAVDEQHAIGELRERVVEGTIGELTLECGEPDERLVEAAALDGERDEVGKLLEVLIIGAGFTAIRRVHPERHVSNRA